MTEEATMDDARALTRLPEFARPFVEVLEAHSEEIVLGVLTLMVAWLSFWILRVTLRKFFGGGVAEEIDCTDGRTVDDVTDDDRPIKPRFRKRDKVLFYGRKIIRKMGSVGASVGSAADNFNINSKARRQILNKVFKRILRDEKENGNPLEEKELPSTMLEVDMNDREAESVLPPDILYMLKSIKVFGHFERPLFLQLCKKMETLRLAEGQWLFRPGDPDDSIFVVQEGLMEIFIQNDGRDILAKVVQPGESVTSLLSVLDVLTGHPEPYKTVSGRAVTDSTILRLPGSAFKDVFKDSPQSLVRIVQVIMVRLQRVTFMALHHYLGLTSELVNPHPQTSAPGHGRSNYDSYQQPKNFSSSPKGSPRKVKRSTSLPRSMATTSDFDAAASRARVGDSAGRTLSPERASRPHDDHPDNSHPPLSTSAPGNQDGASLSSMAQGGSVNFNTIPPNRRAKNSSSKEDVGQPPHTGGVTFAMGGGSSYAGYLDHGNESNILQRATKDLVELLGLPDAELLQDRLILQRYPAGYTIVHQGAQDSELLYVVFGHLSVVQARSKFASGRYAAPMFLGKEIDQPAEESVLYNCHKGDLIDSLAVLTGEPSVFSVRANTNCILVKISKSNFYSIMAKHPTVVLSVAHTIVKRLSGFVRQIDFALDWTHIEAGKAVFRQGDKPDCIYIVLNGRLRSVMQEPGPDNAAKKRLIGEYGRGEIVGLVEVLMQTSRTTTVMAVRDTELAQMPEGLLDAIKQMYPQVVSRLVHLLGTRILGTLKGGSHNAEALSQGTKGGMDMPKVTNLATVAIIAISDDVPIAAFTKELERHLSLIGNTLRLTSEFVQTRLGASAMDTVNEYRLLSWLGMQEDIHRMVLYQCDLSRMTPWTHRCIRQADCLLVVGLASHDPKKLGGVERQLENMSLRCQKELVLLYRNDTKAPSKTAEWLNARGYLFSHHHIKCPNFIFKDRRKSPGSNNKSYNGGKDVDPDAPADRLSDFSRLARFLTGTGIGLVLGGGGARGMAHIGIMKAMMEYKIPIDMVGGTSIGSFVGALWAEERDPAPVADRAKEWCNTMGSLWKKILDLTYPITSMFTGAGFNSSIEDTFGDRQIEDLWIPYFAVTTDISSSQQRIHRSGSLWRYVRSSMSLSGYLPPLCDPKDGHLLLDGGYVNNVPADVMRDLGCQTIIAVDVGSLDEIDLTNYGDSLSGWWLLFNRFSPWSEKVRVPDLNEIQSRLAYVSCVRQLETVKNSTWCHYIRPPIDRFKTLQFYSFREIFECGLHYGQTVFEAWNKGGLLASVYDEKGPDKREVKTSRYQEQSANPTSRTKIQTDYLQGVRPTATFTDLAELVSTIKKPANTVAESDVYDEEEEDDMFDFEEGDDDEFFPDRDEEVFAVDDSELEDLSDPRGQVHLVLENEDGQRVKVPIRPEELVYSGSEEDVDDVEDDPKSEEGVDLVDPTNLVDMLSGGCHEMVAGPPKWGVSAGDVASRGPEVGVATVLMTAPSNNGDSPRDSTRDSTRMTDGEERLSSEDVSNGIMSSTASDPGPISLAALLDATAGSDETSTSGLKKRNQH